jgi:predicted dehydrogenase
VGIADLDLVAAQRAAAGAGFADVELTTSLAELLDRVQADAVINVTIPEATPRSVPRPC